MVLGGSVESANVVQTHDNMFEAVSIALHQTLEAAWGGDGALWHTKQPINANEVYYGLYVRSLREVFASGSRGWYSRTSDRYLILGDRAQNQAQSRVMG